jgi:acetyl-CoA/propionyl-CoA carboxylase carboxyl transferase subunit
MTTALRLRAPGVTTERLDVLFDAWQVVEDVDGVLVGSGEVAGAPLIAFATDPSVQGGALGVEGCGAIVRATELAVRRGVPVVGVWHSGGARLREGTAGLSSVARVFAAQTAASGQVLQVSVVLGPAAGGAAYGPALTDIVVLGPQGRLFVTGPDVVRAVTGQDVDMERLGGADTHTTRSGVVHLACHTDRDALGSARHLVGLVSRPGLLDAGAAAGPDPGERVPDEHRRAYDMRPVVSAVLDAGTMLELQPTWAPNVITSVGRIGKRTVGVVANNPMRKAGCLDATSGDKAGRFVQWCDGLGIPLVFLVDVPGYLPGVGQEDGGVVRRGAKLLHSYAAARVPRITVVLRKSFGGAFIAMGSKGLGADVVLAWPGAHLDVMGASAAVEILHRRALAAEPEPSARAALLARLADEHESETGGLARAVACGAVDRVIDPRDTRSAIVSALAGLPAGRGVRTNGPL